MDIITIILIIALLIGLFVAYRIGRKAGSFERDTYWEGEMPNHRRDAIMKSRAVLGGQFSEQLAPYLPDFDYLPTECRFIGKPIDFIVFKGMDGKDINEIVFVEVKSGNAKLNQHEKNLKETVDKKRVRWVEYRIPEELTKKGDLGDKIGSIISEKNIQEKTQKSYQEKMDEIHNSYPRAYEPWNKEEEQKLLRLFKEGKSPSKIAEILKRQLSSINARLKKLGEIK